MTKFRDSDASERALDRLEAQTGLEVRQHLGPMFARTVQPDLALTNLERWLRVTSNPRLHLEQVMGLPKLGQLLIDILGASQPLADCLIQNPELASILLEPGEISRRPTRAIITAEGRRLLSNKTSYQHALDRLRYLRQRWMLPIVVNDLAATWPPEQVWLALSELADALIELAYDASWENHAQQRQLQGPCPVLVVGFGKLGGNELNYSSDVDLVYIAQDGLDEKADRESSRFVEAFGRALTDRMGRGSLYRVDLRLRPYGAAGAILPSFRAVEAYYDLYAEPWEIQALLRSRPIVGDAALKARWSAMVNRLCFKPKRSEAAVQQMLDMRGRIEELAQGDDLKRGGGGIRDVEFLTQALQILHGFDHPKVRVSSTCNALRALMDEGFLEVSTGKALLIGYTFLRQLEHRTQLIGDQQTHSVPGDPGVREVLARLMLLKSWTELAGALQSHRRTIQTLYQSTLHLQSESPDARTQVMKLLGDSGSAGLHWLDGLPEREAFYEGLVTNADSLTRIRQVLEQAPTLVSVFRHSFPLTEQLISGEIEETVDVTDRISRVPTGASDPQLATAISTAYGHLVARWVLNPTWSLGQELARLYDAVLTELSTRMGGHFSVMALGSYGVRDLIPESDLDLLFLITDPESQAQAETQAQDLLRWVGELHRLGAPLEFDLRLRPDGGRGLLVRTLEGLKAYDLDGMEMWERFALGHARLITGNPEALAAVRHCAFGLPLTPDRLQDLVRMKRRIETERVSPAHVHRQIKLGAGGLSDIEWLVHLTEMRYPTATLAGSTADMVARIVNLGRAQLLNAFEVNALRNARNYLLRVRTRIALLGFTRDLIPENPDKLEKLASVVSLSPGLGPLTGNELLAIHEETTQHVRHLFIECLERLRA